MSKYLVFTKSSLLFILFLLLSSCDRDFSEVKKLGDTYQTIEDVSNIIANDFYQSCLRASLYPADARLFGINEYTRALERSRDNCDQKYPELVMNVKGSYSVQTEYLKHLSSLADSSTGEITSEQKGELESAITGLTGSLANVGIPIPEVVSQNVGKVGSNVISAIFEFVGNEIREDTIIPTMICTDDSFRKYTDGLIALSEEAYVNQLRIEQNEYQSHLTNFTPRGGAGPLTITEATVIFNMQREVAGLMNSTFEREKVARDFATVLDQTAQTHHTISQMFAEEWNLADLEERKAFCSRKYGETIQVRDFTLSTQTALEIQKTLSGFQEEIEPSLNRITSTKFYKDTR